MLLASAIITGLGFLSTVPELIKFRKHSKEETLLISVFELLAENGISPYNARESLIKKGFSKKMVDAICKTYNFQIKPHPLAKRMHKMLKSKK